MPGRAPGLYPQPLPTQEFSRGGLTHAQSAKRGGAACVLQLGRWGRESLEKLDATLAAHQVTDLYVLKGGTRDGMVSSLPWVRTLVHAVFDGQQPHGASYARISPCVPGSAAAGSPATAQ